MLKKNLNRLEIPGNGVPDEVPPKVFIPIGDKVALHMHPVSANEKGIILPDGSENPYQTNLCTVIAVGPECLQVKEGDTVFVTPVMAFNYHHKGKKYIMVKEEELAGILLEGFTID